jgi:hypothetical protein
LTQKKGALKQFYAKYKIYLLGFFGLWFTIGGILSLAGYDNGGNIAVILIGGLLTAPVTLLYRLLGTLISIPVDLSDAELGRYIDSMNFTASAAGFIVLAAGLFMLFWLIRPKLKSLF